MATKTSLLGLTKPGYSDVQDVGVINANMEIIDQEMGKRSRAHNLLVNSNFRTNQRGQTTYTGNGYSIDCWRSFYADTTHTVTESGILVSATDGNPKIYQVIDPNAIDTNKTYTAAVCDSAGNVSVKTMRPTATVYSPVCVYISGSNMLFRIDGANTWRWAALYEGEYTLETLPAYVPKDYVAELLACQQHAIPLGGFYRYRAVQITSSYIDFCINLPIKMRATPTFNKDALTVYGMSNGVITTQSGFTFAILQVSATGIVIRATKANHGCTDAFLNIAEGTVFSAER